MHRIEHNQKLAKAWFDKRGGHPYAPVVSKQLPTVIVNRRALFPYGYNPSIIQFGGRTLMAYRYHPNNKPASELAIAELDDQFRVVKNTPITLPPASNEDPRLFEWDGKLCISYTVSTVPNPAPTCVVRWGYLKESKTWEVEGQWLPKYGQNDSSAQEKNWIFYESHGQLAMRYANWPKIVTLTVVNDVVKEKDIADGIRWKWGQIKGGTKEVRSANGRLVRFFHSRLDNEPIPFRWRYYIGAQDMESGAISRKPILRGSELDDLSQTEASSCMHRKSNVVFPAGAIATKTGWMLSVGINDCLCGLVNIEEKDLNL